MTNHIQTVVEVNATRGLSTDLQVGDPTKIILQTIKYRQSPLKNQPINHKVDNFFKSNIKVLCENYCDHANKLKLCQ